MLEAMKEVRALDVSKNGFIDANEFQRLLNPDVHAAARLKGKVDSLWAAMPKDANGSIERLACWAVLLADAELADLVGSGDAAKGKQ